MRERTYGIFGGLWGSFAVLAWILTVGFLVSAIWLPPRGIAFWYAEGSFFTVACMATFGWAAYRRKARPSRWPLGRRWWTRIGDRLEDALAAAERAIFWPAVFAAAPVWTLSGIYLYRSFRAPQTILESSLTTLYVMLDLFIGSILERGIRERWRRRRR